MIAAISLSLGFAACDRDQADAESRGPMQHGQMQHEQMQHQAAAVKTQAEQKMVNVTVDEKGFTPSRIEVKRGADTTLEFTRTSDSTCAKKVVFPELEVEKDLPLNQAVAVKVPTSEARTLTFQCGMGMYKSAVVIN